ncbi:MAG: acylphosphatase [Candidatus Paceibacterota bacterium]|jgi:acylphosphatase
MSKRINLKIYGRVQGVFFRDSAQKEARKLGLVGFARNDVDGTVYIEVEGEEEKLNEFIKWCQNGPDHAQVDKVEMQWLKATETFSDFKIK